jgi:hypothetical protein
MKDPLPQLGIGMFAVAFLGYWALLAYCDMWRPAPLGLRLKTDAGRIVVDDLVSGGPGARAGLRTRDQIISVNGYPVGGRLDWMTVEANYQLGQPTPLSVDRNGAVFDVALSPMPASWESWRGDHGPELLLVRMTQLVTLLLAFLVAMKRSRNATALVGAAFLATIGVFSVVLPSRLASVWRALPPPASLLLWVPFLSSGAIATWAFSFFEVFPGVRFRSRLAWVAVWLPIVPGLLGQGLYGYYTIVRGRPAPPVPWVQPLLGASAAYVVAALTALVLNYRWLTDVNEKRRMRVLVVGSVVGAIGGMPVVLLYWQTSANNLGQPLLASPFAPFGTLLFLALPLSFAYAILRHRLFDLRLMIRQSLRYVMARRALIGLVPALLIVLGTDLVAHGDEAVSAVLRHRAWIYLTLVGLAVVARLRQHEWLDSLDRRFFRERYSAQRLLRQLAEHVQLATSLESVAPTVVSRIQEALHPASVALLVREADGRRYRTIASTHQDGIARELDAENKVLALARLVGKPLEITGSETEWLARKMPIADVCSIQAAAIDLIVPVASVGGDAPALFALGPKRSEEPYSDDDSELLMAIAQNLALRLSGVGVTLPRGDDRFEECPTCGGCYSSGTGRCCWDGALLAHVIAPRLLARRYQLERRLGRGGMGTVYVALDTLLDRHVAVKLVREDLVGIPGALARFQREARMAAAFSHPNVVTVYDFGVAGTHAFLVMELLDGRTLRDALHSAQRIECHRALSILRDVTSAVEAAHGRQLVHRDLKPENIGLVSHGPGERAKVLDFGLAKFLAPLGGDPMMSQATSTAVFGTPLYMSPEQLRGEDPDPTWDLWALAVIAFEMLCGSHPFASVTPFSGIRVHDAASSDPRFQTLPSGCQAFFTRALALDRAARPSSAASFFDEFERSLYA